MRAKPIVYIAEHLFEPGKYKEVHFSSKLPEKATAIELHSVIANYTNGTGTTCATGKAILSLMRGRIDLPLEPQLQIQGISVNPDEPTRYTNPPLYRREHGDLKFKITWHYEITLRFHTKFSLLFSAKSFED